MLDNPEYTLGIRARYGEAGTDGKIRLGALANWFQEAAGHNASALGFGDERLFAEGKTWILTRMAFRIKDLPSPGDRVNVRTWPAKLEHLGHRGYEVYSPSGELVVAAVSAWTVMDLAARRLTSLPEHLAALYPVKTLPCIPFSSRTIPRLREGIRSADVHTLNGAQYGQLLISRPDDPMVCHRAIEYLKERGLTVEEVRALATGLTFTGMEAVENGLADEIGTREDAVVKAAELAGSSTTKTVMLDNPSSSLSELLNLMSESRLSADDLAQALKELENDGSLAR